MSLDKREREGAEKARRTKELAAQKLRSETSFAIAAEIAEWVEDEGLTPELWPLLLPVVLCVAGHAGVEYVCRRRGCADSAALLTLAAGLSRSGMQALFVELLVSDDLESCASSPSPSYFSDALRPLMKHFAVSAKDCEASAKVKLAAKSPRKTA